MNNSKCRLLAGLSLLLIAIAYGVSLYLAEPEPVYSVYANWRQYALQTVLMAASGWLVVRAYRRIREEEKDFWLVLLITGAVLLAAAGLAVQYSSWRTVVQQLMVGLWPLLLYPLVWFLRRKGEKWYPAVPYYGVVALGCWVVLDLLEVVEWFRWDLITLFYLVVTAVLVWKSYYVPFRVLITRHDEKWFRKSAFALRRVLSWMPVVVTALLALCFHERLQFIFMSLSRPFDGGNELFEVNWLGHRVRLLLQCWQGDYSLMEPFSVPLLPIRAPLLWISHCLTPAGAAVVVGLEIFLVWLLLHQGRSSTRRSLCFAQVLVWSVLVQVVLGLAGELMGNITTRLSAPLLRSAAGFWLLPLALDADVYTPALWDSLGDWAVEKMDELLQKAGIREEPDALPEDWLRFCPPWEGWMQLRSDWDYSRGRPFGLLQLRWVSRDEDDDGIPQQSRIPEPVTTTYHSFPIEAAGKSYQNPGQLLGKGNSPHLFLHRDIYGREVFLLRKRANPALDVFDTLYDTARTEYYFLREHDRLTCICLMGDIITVTEDVGELDSELWEDMTYYRYFEE